MLRMPRTDSGLLFLCYGAIYWSPHSVGWVCVGCLAQQKRCYFDRGRVAYYNINFIHNVHYLFELIILNNIWKYVRTGTTNLSAPLTTPRQRH